MRAALFYGKNDLRIQNYDLPSLKEGEILVKVKACGICGTDVHIFNGEEGSAKVTPPIILGHEFCGEVVESKSSLFKIGDKVSIDPNIYCGVCRFCRSGKPQLCENLVALGVNLNGGFAEYAAVPEKQAIRFDNIDFGEAALAEPLACCLHGVERLKIIKPTDKVLIIGLGPIGLIMLEILKSVGVTEVYGYEIDKFRKDMALRQGVKRIIEADTDEKFDIVIECAGVKQSIEMAFKLADKGAQVLIFSVPSPNINVLLNPFEMFKKEVSIYWSFVNPFTQKSAIDLLESKKISLKHVISHRITLSELRNALTKRFENQLKVIVTP